MKGKQSQTTNKDMADESYQEALTSFVDLVQHRTAKHFAEHLENLEPPTYTVMSGRKYDRIVKEDGTGSRSVYCFVRKAGSEDTTAKGTQRGDILKAAGWSGPAKHARGNIFNDDPLEGTTRYGAQYMRG